MKKNTEFCFLLQIYLKRIYGSAAQQQGNGAQFTLSLLCSCHHAAAVFIKEKKRGCRAEMQSDHS